MKTILIGEQSIRGSVSGMVSSVSLDPSASPLRYPGGKAKFVRALASHIQSSRRELVEACAGGASLGLAMMKAELIDELHINDRDPQVFNFWQVLTSELGIHMVEWLDKHPEPTHNDFLDAKLSLQSPIRRTKDSKLEHAWAYLLVNRLAFGGNVQAGPIGGYDSPDDILRSRWDPEELKTRLMFVYDRRARINVTHWNVLDMIEGMPKRSASNITIFFDPPQWKKEKSPYLVNMDLADHRALMNQVYDYQGDLDFLVTLESDRVGAEWKTLFGEGAVLL